MMIDDLVAQSNKVVGVKQTKRAFEESEVAKIYIATDCDERIKDELLELCKQNSVLFEMENTMSDLGSICSIDVGAAVVTILKG